MATIPIVLRFSGIAKNYNLCFVLTTPQAVWSMGSGEGDCLGISYNMLTLDSKRMSCIQRIEYTGSILTICTGPVVGGDCELTAFIEVPDGVDWLQGYCVLNEGARVLARLGDLDPVEWRGEINCEIPILLPNIHRATFLVRGIVQGQSMRINLANDGLTHTRVRWCAAVHRNSRIGLRLMSPRGGDSLPVGTFRLDAENIDLIAANSQRGQNANTDLIVEAYIERSGECRYCPPIEHVRIKIECDDPVTATVQIGNRRPQYLAQAYKLFML